MNGKAANSPERKIPLVHQRSMGCQVNFPRRLWMPIVMVCLLGVSLSLGKAAGETIPTTADQEMEAGVSLFQKGKFPQAALRWDSAARLYEQEGKPNEQAQALTNLAQALQQIGQYHKAELTLQYALDLVKDTQKPLQMASILGRLGNVNFTMGEYGQAIQFLQEGLSLSRNLENSTLSASLLNDLGNVLAATKSSSEALAAYTESSILAKATGNHLLAVTAIVNAARVSVNQGNMKDAAERLTLGLQEQQEVSDSFGRAQVLLNIGMLYLAMEKQAPSLPPQQRRQAEEAFQLARTIGENLQDKRTISYAWGYLGQLYEKEGRVEEALAMTRRSILAAQEAQAPESLYQWEWQTGRLLKAMNKPADALLAYQRALSTLQPIRNELSYGSVRPDKTFRETIGPLFFEVADLLLHQAASSGDGTPKEGQFLRQARDTVELFKATELQDYFRDDCVQTAQSGATIIDRVNESTAVVYPIILPDRLELLVSMAGKLKRWAVPVSQSTLTHEIRQFRKTLEKRTTHQYLPHAQQLYQWLVEPIEEELKNKGITTLVFVPDGPMQTIPFAPLHDGKQFLIESYALATTPGLKLTDPRPIDRQNLKILSVGLTESVQGFPALPYVENEINDIEGMYGGAQLVDKDFNVLEMEREMRHTPFTIVHIASHGQFSGDANKTFVLAFDGKMTMDRLDQLIGLYQFREQPLDLLTLSACETAAGSDKAALGLAGVAIKAGARSALATLWFINDKASSDLVAEFYRQLKNSSNSKAEAIRQPQLQLLHNPQYTHPGYWSPFLLLNNWL